MADATSFHIADDGAATTIAAQATKTFKAYTGGETSGIVGDVLIVQEGIVAEAIGLIGENGARGELFSGFVHWSLAVIWTGTDPHRPLHLQTSLPATSKTGLAIASLWITMACKPKRRTRPRSRARRTS